MSIALNVYSPLHKSSTGSNTTILITLDHQASLTTAPDIIEWERTHKLRGGPYSANLRMIGDESGDLRKIFFNWIGYRIEEGQNDDWFGVIRAMEYKRDGFTMRISLDGVANRVDVYYEPETGLPGRVGFQDATSDQRTYGIIEKVVEIKGDATLATAVRQAYLAQSSSPYFDIVDVHPNDQDVELTIECVGQAYYLNQYYPDVQAIITGGATTPTDIILKIIEGHPYFSLLGGKFEANAVAVNEAEPNLSALAYINELCDLGGVNGEPWTFLFDKWGRFRYLPVPDRAQYKLEAGEFRYESGGATIAPRDVRPGVVFIGAAPRSLRSSAHWLESVGDVLIDEVTVGTDNKGNDVLKLGKPRGGYIVGG